MRFRKILITGGTGQVGSALLATAPPGATLAAPSSQELDIRNPASVRQAFAKWHPDFLINAAAYTKVDQAEDQPELAFALNAAAPGHLAAACAAAECPMLHLSTDYVFDGAKASPYVETDVPAPINTYGQSKLQGEREVANALHAHLILRVSWVFSASGANFVKTMLGLAAREELRVVCDQRGTPTSAHSIAKAVWRILEGLAKAPSYGVYHFASRPVVTWHEFAAEIFAIAAKLQRLARTPRLQAVPSLDYQTAAPRPRNSVLDGARLQRAFGLAAGDWRPELAGIVRQLA